MKRFLTLFILLMVIPAVLWPEIAATFTKFHYPKNLVIDGEQMLVSDYPSIHILSLKDYSILKTFGREGSGPGEFWIDKMIVDNKEMGLQLRVGPDYIMVNSFLWFTYFTREGKFIKTLRLKDFRHGARFWPVGKYYAAIKAVFVGKRVYIIVALFDQKLEQVKEFYRIKNWRQGDNDKLDFFARAAHSVIFNVYDNKIFVVKGGDQEFRMDVYDQEGNKLYTITRETEKIKVPKTFIKEVHDWFRIKFKLGLQWNMRNTIFPEYFPAIRDFKLADKKIYVLTHKREGNKNEVIILDLKGKFLKKTMIPVSERNPESFHAYAFHKGTFYQFVENDEEETWELHVTKIE